MIAPQRALLAVALFLAGTSLAHAEDPWTHHFLKMSDGAKLHYVEMGQGTPVILLHGAGGSGEGNWMRNGIGPALAKTNRLIAPDQRGHAYTDAGDRSKMAQDVLELMNHLGIEKAHIGGFSMGGGVTARLLATNPERFITAHFGGSGVRETAEWSGKLESWSGKFRKLKDKAGGVAPQPAPTTPGSVVAAPPPPPPAG